MPEQDTLEIPESMEQLASQFNQSIESGRPLAYKDTEKPKEAAPEPEPEAKPDEKPTEAKPAEEKKSDKPESATSKMLKKKEAPKEEAKPADEKVIDWKSAPKDFREAHNRLLDKHKTVEQQAKEFQTKIGDYEKRIAEIEAKPKETAADTKLLEELKARIKDYEQRIADMDYRQSDEFKQKFVQPFEQRYKQAVTQISQLRVATGKNEDTGEIQYRQATQNDFNGLMKLEFGDQRRMARAMFGEDYDVVIGHLNRLSEIQSDANAAVEQSKATYETRNQEARTKEQESQRQYMGFVEEYRNGFRKDYKDYFEAPEGDVEAKTELEKGREFVSNYKANGSKMTPQERAEHTAFIEEMASAGFMQKHIAEQLRSKVDSLTKELADLRGGDPGNAGSKPAPVTKDDDEMGIMDAAKWAAEHTS